MQYVIQRDRSEQVVVKVEDGKVKIFQRIGSLLRPKAVFLTKEEAVTIAKIILKEVSHENSDRTQGKGYIEQLSIRRGEEVY